MNSKKSNLHKARSFTNTFYFIDDFYAINDNYLFEKHFKEIYLEELELKKEKISSTKVSFLDTDLDIKDNKISSKLYDKQDFFSFGIVHLTFCNSNIPSKSFQSSTGSKILRLARSTSNRVIYIILPNNDS